MKKLIAALALLTVALVVIALRMQDSDRVADLESRPLLNEAQLAQLAEVERITLSRGDASVELVRTDKDWGVAEHHLFPAQRERLAALLHALRGARILEDQTANPDHHARLGLDPDAEGAETLAVNLKGDAEITLLYGNTVGSGQLVRFADDDQVWLVNRPLSMTVNSSEWLALDVIDIPMEQLSSARWEHADGEVLQLDKAEEGDYNFRLAGLEPALQAGNERWVNSMVLALANLRAQSVALREDLQLQEPLLRMQMQTWQDAELHADLHDIDGRYWLVIDRFVSPEDVELEVNADERWAYQLAIGQVEQLVKRHADIVRNQPEQAGQE
ncbi:DUF4340 domain-containing protein [Pseudomonas profundi]|uniref:DUF4340 domain-containing protein n=1 Tax=Pseudomonas profundi TaxID=1981513 RepID=UPI00123BC581|nr:DUF4340 domain-containing protein [Pseudomonas profundi]